MPEAAAQSTTLQSVTQTQNQQQQPATQPGAPVAPPPPNLENKTAVEIAQLRKAYENKSREFITERRKWETEKKGLGPKLSRLSEFEKREQLARLNPPEFLKSIYGEKWADHLREVMVSGVAPADLVASEISKLKEDFARQLEERDTQRKSGDAEAIKKSVENANKSLNLEVSKFFASNSKEFPVLAELGDKRAIAAIVARIKEEYFKSEERDAQTNELLIQGKIITPKEAAELIENEWLALNEKTIAHEKYRQKLMERLQPKKEASTVAVQSKQPSSQQSSPVQQKRTLSNDLTGMTPRRTPAATDAERRERAIAAISAARGRSAT